ncbi:hypothetical protein Gorai_022331, partial [Gossypium raimondii]|nr:hypothetical protein [Gossypium raimondii]
MHSEAQLAWQATVDLQRDGAPQEDEAQPLIVDIPTLAPPPSPCSLSLLDVIH